MNPADVSTSLPLPARPVKQVMGKTIAAHWHDRVAQGTLLLACLALVVFLLLPVLWILLKSLEDHAGNYVGLHQFLEYLATPSLHLVVLHTLEMAASVTLLVIPAAFLFAYALTRSKMPGKALFRALSLIPILAPSLLPAISLIQWFGTQGLLKDLLGDTSIYGFRGIVLSECYCVFPHALMIIMSALAMADGRLYEVAASLGTGRWRRFITITLPGAKYGLVSAALLVLSYTVSDFGVPQVIGGNFNVLSVDVYKLVIGQQDFNQGAVVGVLLLLPALFAFGADIFVRRKMQSQMSSNTVAFVPKRRPWFEALMFLYCSLVCFLLLAILGMAIYTSFIKLWPYDLSLGWQHYRYGLMEGGLEEAWLNSLKMAALVSVFGTALIFSIAYLTEKMRGMHGLRMAVRLLATLPMGIPGLLLGLGYILFFNMPANPLNFMYHGMAILVVATIVHYYSSGHLTAATALCAIDKEFEAVSASLKVPFYKTFFRVTVPICLPAILDIGRYLFVNAMTTISAAVFLYSPETMLASVSILNLEESGDIGPAAAMATLIVLTSSCICLLYALCTRFLLRRTQEWRRC